MDGRFVLPRCCCPDGGGQTPPPGPIFCGIPICLTATAPGWDWGSLHRLQLRSYGTAIRYEGMLVGTYNGSPDSYNPDLWVAGTEYNILLGVTYVVASKEIGIWIGASSYVVQNVPEVSGDLAQNESPLGAGSVLIFKSTNIFDAGGTETFSHNEITFGDTETSFFDGIQIQLSLTPDTCSTTEKPIRDRDAVAPNWLGGIVDIADVTDSLASPDSRWWWVNRRPSDNSIAGMPVQLINTEDLWVTTETGELRYPSNKRHDFYNHQGEFGNGIRIPVYVGNGDSGNVHNVEFDLLVRNSGETGYENRGSSTAFEFIVVLRMLNSGLNLPWFNFISSNVWEFGTDYFGYCVAMDGDARFDVLNTGSYRISDSLFGDPRFINVLPDGLRHFRFEFRDNGIGFSRTVTLFMDAQPGIDVSDILGTVPPNSEGYMETVNIDFGHGPFFNPAFTKTWAWGNEDTYGIGNFSFTTNAQPLDSTLPCTSYDYQKYNHDETYEWRFSVNQVASLAPVINGLINPLSIVSNGALPTGMAVDPITGVISGTPTVVSESGNFSVAVEDSNNQLVNTIVYKWEVIP